MEEIKRAIRAAVIAEYQRAAQRFGVAHNSAHEAYAVMLEEVQEAEEEVASLTCLMEEFWRCVRHNTKTHAIVGDIRENAIIAAAELVQVAAMADKAIMAYGCERGRPDHGED